MHELPSSRKMEVLRGVCLGEIEDDVHFTGVGRTTSIGMLAKGWIEQAVCETYETNGDRITSAGKNAHRVGFDAVKQSPTKEC